ncbi:MAG: hypothetical protein M1827_004132 [Pycnora praestabilis]|nr:MAG: hypothetical protein M1827_004132 [Pycnora praestabilis]
MCFGRSKDTSGGYELARSQEIDKLLRQDGKKMRTTVKLLLLGAGESGKSTVLKQMKLLYSEGFSSNERLEYRVIIFSNLINAFKVILDAMEEMDISFEIVEHENFAGIILAEPEIMPQQSFPFFADIDRLFAKDYIPTDQDVLRSRLRTTGITETIFELGTLTYRMFDVGGQRSERKKWIHCFEGVSCLLFLVAISGYDQCLVEDKDANQMQEALMLFESIVNSQWFNRSSIILFLNKIDLFKAKLESSRINKYFPDYKDNPTDWKAASNYFAERFRGLNRNPAKELYTHFTNATDTNLLKITMASVQDMIIQKNLNTLIL